MAKTTKKPRDIRFVFFGTSRFAVGVLDELCRSGFTPALVVAGADTKRGRGMEIKPPPTKVWAGERNIAVAQPEKLNERFIGELQNSEWDVFVVASYGKLLPKKLLEMPQRGTLNVHPSLLPRWRGASPIQASILHDDETGVSIMLLDEEMDHGPIVAQARISPEEWPIKAGLLRELLAAEGGKLLAEVMLPFLSGEITPEEQEHEQATFCKKVQREDGLIDLNGEPQQNFRKIQAYSPTPGAYFFVERGGKHMRVKVAQASLRDSGLVIERVVPEGKREMDYQDFLRG